MAKPKDIRTGWRRHMPFVRSEHTTPHEEQGPWVPYLALLWGAPSAVLALYFLLGLGIAHLRNGGAHLFARGFYYWLQMYVFPSLNPFTWTGWAYLLLAVWSGVSLWIILNLRHAYSSDSYSSSAMEHEFVAPWNVPGGLRKLAALATIVATLFGLVWLWPSTIGSDKAAGIYAAPSVEFAVGNTHHLPASLADITDNSHLGNGKPCVIVGNADVPSCIIQKQLPMEFVARRASADAAYAKMSKASVGASNTTVLQETLTYLYTNGGMWSAIRDGINGRSLYSIVQWNGTGNTTECTFSGPYALKGAFEGKWSNNLLSALAKHFPNLFVDTANAWGYCRGREPVVVLPVTQIVQNYNRTSPTYGGVVTIRGDHGRAVFTHIANVHPGMFPGPAYPLTLADQMINSDDNLSSWAAGRKDRSRDQFGYEPTNSLTQFGNLAEYLLRDPVTGLEWWVTPLTPRGSDSQQFVTWAFTDAMSGHEGQLNKTVLYVLGNNDPRIVNLYDLTSRATQSIIGVSPGFFNGGVSGGGQIVEFLPVNIARRWQVYGEANQRVRYLLDCRPNVNALCTVHDLLAPTGSTGVNVPGSHGVCGLPLARMTPAQIGVCDLQFAQAAKNQLANPSTAK